MNIDLDRLIDAAKMRSKLHEVRAPATWVGSRGVRPVCLECQDQPGVPRAQRRGESQGCCAKCGRGVWVP
jgi:hypothetical protein